MKKHLMKTMLAITGLLASTSVMAEGYDFKVDDIYYNITSKENLTVEVTNSLGGEYGVAVGIRQSDYKGDITFPATVTYNDTTYAVKSIGCGAFSSSNQVTSVTIPASIDTLKESSIRTVLALNENGEMVRHYNCPPKVIIEYGESPLYGGNVAISTSELYVNREMKWYNTNLGWGHHIVYDTKRIEFGDSVKVINPYLFCYNKSLTEVKFPNHSFSFNAYSGCDFHDYYGIFEGCSALEKVDLSNLVPARSYYKWVDSDDDYYNGGYYTVQTSLRNSYFIPPMTFKGCTALKEVILPDTIAYLNGDNVVTAVYNHFIGARAFEGCGALENIKFPVATFDGRIQNRIGHRIGVRAFAGSGLKSLEMPSFVSCIDNGAFADCASLESVTLPSQLDWYRLNYEERADYESYPEQNNGDRYNYYLSKGLFANCANLKTVDFGCIRIVMPNTFAGCKVENIKLNEVSNLTTGNFASPNLKTISISEYNTTYKIEDNILKSIDGKSWLLSTGKNYNGPTVIKNDSVVSIEAQLFDGLPIESYDLPMLYNIGYRAFANTRLKSVAIKDSTLFVGDYGDTLITDVSYGEEAFADCKLLEEYTIDPDVVNLPKGLFKNCELLTGSHEFHKSATTIPAEIFYGTGVNEFTFGEKVELINESAMPAGTTDITLYASLIPEVAESDMVEYISNVTLVVPSSCVDQYSAHKFWGRAKEIVANSDYEGHGFSGYIEPASNGLYFAKKGGNICYYDMDKKEVVDTYIPAGAHTFQLASWHGAIYGVNAGEQYLYTNDTNDEYGDGELYVINKRETGFSKSTVVNNKNRGDGGVYQAYLDPFHIMIDNDSIYYTNRNFTANAYTTGNIHGINVLPAKEVYATPYMSSDDVPTFASAQRLSYYNRGIAYGAISAGLQRDSEGVYWLALNYSGNGIYRFKESDIYQNANQAQNAQPPYSVVASGIKPSAMFLDEKNDYIYIFSTHASNHGVYRTSISAIRNGSTASFPNNWTLIDNSPASPENTSSEEGVYVRQFTTDGDYIYWAYIADGYLNKSGIKRVNATGTPVVEYVVEDVEAYGICYYEYDGSRSPAVETKEQSATFAIPRVDNATQYTLNVYYDAEKTQLAKTVHYDETGKIIPMSDYIELTIDGFENGDYYYDVVAKSESGDVLNSYTGSFEIEYTGVENISINNNAVEVARYDIYGRKLNEATTGVNIVKYSDGTTKKVIIKK